MASHRYWCYTARGKLQLIVRRFLILHHAAREERVVGGKVRKYYTITDAGRCAPGEARPKIRELVAEVLEGHGPMRLPGPPPDADDAAAPDAADS